MSSAVQDDTVSDSQHPLFQISGSDSSELAFFKVVCQITLYQTLSTDYINLLSLKSYSGIATDYLQQLHQLLEMHHSTQCPKLKSQSLLDIFQVCHLSLSEFSKFKAPLQDFSISIPPSYMQNNIFDQQRIRNYLLNKQTSSTKIVFNPSYALLTKLVQNGDFTEELRFCLNQKTDSFVLQQQMIPKILKTVVGEENYVQCFKMLIQVLICGNKDSNTVFFLNQTILRQQQIETDTNGQNKYQQLITECDEYLKATSMQIKHVTHKKIVLEIKTVLQNEFLNKNEIIDQLQINQEFINGKCINTEQMLTEFNTRTGKGFKLTYTLIFALVLKGQHKINDEQFQDEVKKALIMNGIPIRDIRFE
ncbi:Hypothetical_protein [Hexamita inflata]|uniref:Hypothetical_protein n=1 Tax=Hexamita inflata TaxID=28002 RepID=A0AA86RM76_9EUKA|nr:Hypothetical protein HINF_LOCUS56665 [Hexamita inflata]